MIARMHPLFAELFIDPPSDHDDSDETRRARRARARRVRRLQAASPRPVRARTDRRG